MATAMALEDDGREGTGRVARASFDSVVDEDEDGSLASAASGSGSASEEGGDGFSSARDEEDATTTLRSVLTRKPSVAALKALGTLGRGAGSGGWGQFLLCLLFAQEEEEAEAEAQQGGRCVKNIFSQA